MKRIFIFTALLLIHVFHLKAQTTCDEIKKENEYLKKMLKITETDSKQTIDFTEIKLLKAIGDSKNQTVTIELLLTNKKANKWVRLNNPKVIDLEGNTYLGYEMLSGGFKIGTLSNNETINTNVPVKAIAVFKKILPEVKIMNALEFEYSSEDHSDIINVQFNSIKINWK